MRFENDHGALVFYHQGETVRIEAWGKDALRVRSTMFSQFTGNDWALTEEVADSQATVTIEEEPHWVDCCDHERAYQGSRKFCRHYFLL